MDKQSKKFLDADSHFTEFLKACYRYNPAVTADDVCDLIACQKCPFNFMSDEDYTVCQKAVGIVLDAVKED